MTLPVIGFAGMTHLGLVSGVSAAKKGFKLICYDADVARIADLNKQKLPVSEPQLDDLVVKNKQNSRSPQILLTYKNVMLSTLPQTSLQMTTDRAI